MGTVNEKVLEITRREVLPPDADRDDFIKFRRPETYAAITRFLNHHRLTQPEESGIPILDCNLAVRRTSGPAYDERARVLSADQIAAIRQKMQEKLDASRKGA